MSMKALLISLIMFMAAATLLADNSKDAGKFSPGPASSYPAKQTNDHVTVAAIAYDTEELAHSAFGKLNPNQYGVLPVLVIIQNDSGQALRMSNMQAEYIGPDDRHIASTPAADLPYTIGGPKRPNPGGDT